MDVMLGQAAHKGHTGTLRYMAPEVVAQRIGTCLYSSLLNMSQLMLPLACMSSLAFVLRLNQDVMMT